VRAVIIGNGEAHIGPRLRRVLDEAALIVCADGGATHALAAGVRPTVIVGDLDSTPPAVLAYWQAQGVPVERHPVAKDETDLELAIGWARGRGATEVALLATLGGRLDQTLANVLLLSLPAFADLTLRLEDEQTSLALLRGGQALTIEGTLGDTISLLPLSEVAQGVRTAGLRYPLHGEPLYRGPTRGVSNELQVSPARVSLEQGLLLVVHLRTGPDAAPDSGPGS